MNSQYLKKKKLPDAPGVYFFLDKNKKPIYIGKATSLADRIKSYFSKDLFSTRGALLVKMLEEAVSIDVKETKSVLEALLLEADLIKKFKPIYNTKEKDDKSFNCIVLTDEDFPQVLVVRKKDIDFNELTAISYKLKAIYGPYPNGSQLKEALKIIRKIFPYRDGKCKLQAPSTKIPLKPCFNYSIGLCPGTCIGAIEKKCYAKRIKRLKLFFSGNIEKLVFDLKKDMNKLAQEHNFEAAKIIRDKIYNINHIQDVALIKYDSNFGSNPSDQMFRIEAYDVAHLGGKNMVGVMTVFENRNPEKSLYKKFNIKSVTSSNDTGALREILTRRFAHLEWGIPNLVVVDGGGAQINVAKEVLKYYRLSIPVVSVLKDERHKPKEILGEEDFVSKYKREIIFANSEAHRFAIAFHKKKRKKDFLKK